METIRSIEPQRLLDRSEADKNLMDGMADIKVNKINREANNCADSLAKHGLNLHCSNSIFNDFPFFLYNILLGDLTGIR